MGHLEAPADTASTIGVICGLQSEASCIDRAVGDLRSRIHVRISGASADQAEQQARELVDSGVATLVSFGLAGALDPGIPVGTVIETSRVACETGTFGPEDRQVAWGSDRLVLTAGEKTALYGRTGASLVDMESHRVARVASRAGRPFLVIRAISDDAGTTLPDYIEGAVDVSGQPRLSRIFAGALRRPRTIIDLIQLGRNTRQALTALENAGRRTLPALLRSLDAG